MKQESHFTSCFITGASSGIGEALCYLLADHGIDLIITGRDASNLEKIQTDLKSKVKVDVLVADLKDPKDRLSLIENIHLKKPDLIINNAGFGFYGSAVDDNIQDQLNIVNVNINALVEITLESAKYFKLKGIKGTILNVSSAASFQVFPGFSVYSASKAFVNQFSESLDYEMKPFKIRVLTACPGMVNTEFRSRASRGKYCDTPGNSMTAEFAAKEIWRQIIKGKSLHIFNWRYRLAIFFTRYLLPTSMVAKHLYSNISKRTGK
jgi:short-subunit dehydrogenase